MTRKTLWLSMQQWEKTLKTYRITGFLVPIQEANNKLDRKSIDNLCR